MIECIMAWVLLFWGIGMRDANFFIASGVFAVAANIVFWRESQEKRNGK